MKKHRYIDEYGLLLEGEHGSKGDALLRSFYLLHSARYTNLNGMGLIESEKICKRIIDGFQACTTDHTKTNGIARHPDLKDDNDTSMDAMIGWMLILKSSMGTRHMGYKRIINRLPRQISTKWRWTSWWWSWVKYQSGEKKGRLFLLGTIGMGLAYALNIWTLFMFDYKKGDKYLNFFNVHLNVWMLAAMDRTWGVKVAQWFLALAVPKSNVLLRLLLHKKFDSSMFPLPRRGWRWERLPWVKYHGINNDVIDKQHVGYPIDCTILEAVYNSRYI